MVSKMSIEHSCQIRVLFQVSGVRGKALYKMFPQYSRSCIYEHAAKPINGEPTFDKRKYNKGVKKVSLHDERNVLRTLQKLRVTDGSFTSQRIQLDSGVGSKVCNRTVRRVLNKNGYGYYQSRKKGMLLKKDLSIRLRFCQKVKRMGFGPDLWTTGISFYLDGKGFEYKSNPMDQARAPRAREWRKKGEGLSFRCTAKGKKEGSQKANFMVAMSFSRGVVMCTQYFGSITGQKFADIVKSDFPRAFENSSNPKGKLVLMDGCPRQNSATALAAIDSVSGRVLKIPPRSPDLNPIENFFHLICVELAKEAIAKKIDKESFEEFSIRCVQMMESYPVSKIDAIIDSMPKRIDMVIKSKGQRIKY